MKTYCTAVASPPLQLYKDTLNKALDYLKPQSGHRRSAGMPSVDGPLQLVQQAVVHEGGIFTVSIKDGSPLPRLTTHMYFNALRSMAMFRSGYSYAGRESWCKRSGLWSRASSMTWIHTSGQRRPFQPVRHCTPSTTPLLWLRVLLCGVDTLVVIYTRRRAVSVIICAGLEVVVAASILFSLFLLIIIIDLHALRTAAASIKICVIVKNEAKLEPNLY